MKLFSYSFNDTSLIFTHVYFFGVMKNEKINPFYVWLKMYMRFQAELHTLISSLIN